MTFREKLKKEHPEKVYGSAEGGCEGCPQDYGYVKENCPCMVCAECWDREIPTEPKEDMDKEDYENLGYIKGLQDAWELMRKIIEMYSGSCKGILGTYFSPINEGSKNLLLNVINMNTPKEALAKLKAYEETQEIKVGDVVCCEVSNVIGVVMRKSNDEYCHILFGDGSTGQHKINNFKKTGKHIDIESLLGQIRGE